MNSKWLYINAKTAKEISNNPIDYACIFCTQNELLNSYIKRIDEFASLGRFELYLSEDDIIHLAKDIATQDKLSILGFEVDRIVNHKPFRIGWRITSNNGNLSDCMYDKATTAVAYIRIQTACFNGKVPPLLLPLNDNTVESLLADGYDVQRTLENPNYYNITW